MHKELQAGDLLEGEVENIAFGGEGVIKSAGQVVFVPFTAVGDFVRVRVTKLYKNYVIASLEAILRPSQDRVRPLCPHFGICGGCQLQHVSYQAQISSKQQAVEQNLKRIGRIQNLHCQSPSKANLQWAYRRHIRLTLKKKAVGFVSGYIGIDNVSFLEIQQCPIFSQNVEVFEQFQLLVSKLDSTGIEKANATLLKMESETGFIIAFRFENAFPKNFKQMAQEALASPLWKGVSAIAGRAKQAYGVTTVSYKIEDLHVKASPYAFIQNHPEQSYQIYVDVCALIERNQAKQVLDLYCGIGIFSLMLAKRGITTCGVEQNKEAVELARENAIGNGVKNVKFIQADAALELPKNSFFLDIDHLIVNPPRRGLDPKVIEAFKKRLPKKLIYISCMPATLARDLNRLMSLGYKVTFCRIYDMFPQTAHVETIVELTHEL